MAGTWSASSWTEGRSERIKRSRRPTRSWRRRRRSRGRTPPRRVEEGDGLGRTPREERQQPRQLISRRRIREFLPILLLKQPLHTRRRMLPSLTRITREPIKEDTELLLLRPRRGVQRGLRQHRASRVLSPGTTPGIVLNGNTRRISKKDVGDEEREKEKKRKKESEGYKNF